MSTGVFRVHLLLRRTPDLIRPHVRCFPIDKPFGEQIGPAGLLPCVQLHAPKFGDGLLGCRYGTLAAVSDANSMVGTSPRIGTVSARSNHELVEARNVGDVIRF